MDKIDRTILRELQQDGRMANADLAAKVGLTPTPCLRRVRNLEKIGVIRGYRAELDGNFLDSGFHVFAAVVMKHHTISIMTEFESQVAQLPQVIEAHRLFGDPDYLLRIAVADLAAYERFYINVLSGLPCIGKLTSQMTMKEVKAHRGFIAGLERGPSPGSR